MNERALQSSFGVVSNDGHSEASRVPNTIHPPVKIQVKFHRNAVEVKRTVQLKLNVGTHYICFENIDPLAEESSFRITALEGAQGLVSARLRFDLTPDKRVDDLTVAELMHDSSALRKQSESTSTDEPTIDQRIEEVNRSMRRASKAVDQATRLLSEWIGQIYKEPALRVAEWREGLDLLEHTLNERLGHFNSLSETHDRLNAMLLNQESSEPRSSIVSVELDVDKDDHYLIELSYILTSARWLPIYQARVSEDVFDKCGTKPRVESRVHLEMSARFLQATEEDWPHCRAEFSLYPPTVERFPILNYPANETLSIKSVTQHQASSSEVDQLLESPLANLTHLFSDQATLNYTLELDISAQRPQVNVIGTGQLDTLLPLGGGVIHCFVGDEWIDVNDLLPLRLGEQLSLNFGLFAALESSVSSTTLSEDELSELLQTEIPDHKESTTEQRAGQKTQGDDQCLSEHDALSISTITEESSKQDSDRSIDRLTIKVRNVDDQVRTVLLSHPLSRSTLISLDPNRPAGSAPVGWVLSADRSRLMRWLSIAPNRSEELVVYREAHQSRSQEI